MIAGCSRTDFSPQLNHFNKQDFTLIAIDPRGYGQSIPPLRDWPLEYIQRDAEDAIELLRVSKQRNTVMMSQHINSLPTSVFYS